MKSNAIVIVKDGALLGMGAGQPNRLISVELALKLAGDEAQGARCGIGRLSSRSRTGLRWRSQGGVTAAVQPGGSVRDDEVIAAANNARRGHGVHGHPPLQTLGGAYDGHSLPRMRLNRAPPPISLSPSTTRNTHCLSASNACCRIAVRT